MLPQQLLSTPIFFLSLFCGQLRSKRTLVSSGLPDSIALHLLRVLVLISTGSVAQSGNFSLEPQLAAAVRRLEPFDLILARPASPQRSVA